MFPINGTKTGALGGNSDKQDPKSIEIERGTKKLERYDIRQRRAKPTRFIRKQLNDEWNENPIAQPAVFTLDAMRVHHWLLDALLASRQSSSDHPQVTQKLEVSCDRWLFLVPS
jgi:hypothetical protein